jgi:recombination protein RecA
MAPELLIRKIAPFPVPEAPSFAEGLPEGRLVELSGAVGSARTTLALAAVRTAQIRGETAAWVQPAGGPLYPPDFAECGVDASALPVVHVPRESAGLFRAAEILLRSGAFGLVIVDLRTIASTVTDAVQGRLQSLTREHGSRVLLLTDRSHSSHSLGPLVSLRVEPQRTRLGGGRFAIEPCVLKNKHGGPLDLATERRRGPWCPR